MQLSQTGSQWQRQSIPIDTDHLNADLDTNEQYCIELQNRFSAHGDLPDNVEDLWKTVRQKSDTATNVVGQQWKLSKTWLSGAVGELIEKKRVVVLTWNKRERNRQKREFDYRDKEDNKTTIKRFPLC